MLLGSPSVNADIKVELVQREYQVRYQLITGTNLVWPAAPTCQGELIPPPYPWDDFYGDLTRNPALGVVLAKDLVNKFYGDGPAKIADDFLSTSDGTNGIEATATAPGYYTASFTERYVEDVNTNNWAGFVTEIYEHLRELNCTSAYWEFWPFGEFPEQQGYRTASGYSTNDCNDAKYLAGTVWNAGDWASYDPYTVAGAWDSTHASTNEYGETVSYYATYSVDRIYDWGGFGIAGLAKQRVLNCEALVYLQATTNGFDAVGHNPPVATDDLYHLWQAGSANYTNTSEGWGAYYHLSPMLPGDTETTTAQFGSDCPVTGRTTGWKLGAWPLTVYRWTFDPRPSGKNPSGPCAGCDSTPGKVSALTGPAQFNISLGKTWFGENAGFFYVNADLPDLSLYSPGSLGVVLSPSPNIWSYVTGDNDTVYNTGNTEATVHVITATKYGLYFTNLATSNWIATVTVEADGGDTNKLLITSTAAGQASPELTRFDYNPATATWVMETGGGLRKESRTSVWPDSTNQVDTVLIRNSAEEVVFRSEQKFIRFPWGRELVREITGSGGSARTNTWEFYTDPVHANYSQLKQTVDANGHWTKYQYDAYGRETNVVVQLGNTPTSSADTANRVTLTTYADNVITVVEKLQNVEIGRTYTELTVDEMAGTTETATIRCQVPLAGIGHSLNLTNITLMNNATGEPILSISEDGTITTYTEVEGYTETTSIVSNLIPGVTLEGTVSTTVKGVLGETLSYEVRDLASDTVLVADTYTYSDELKQSHSVVHLDGTTNLVQYGCCGLEFTVDRDGTLTEYFHDTLKRQTATRRTDITLTNILDAANNVLATIRIGSNGTPMTLRQAVYNLAGQMTSETNALNGPTAYSETRNGSGQTVRTTTYPDTGTRIETYNQDGTLASQTGTAALTNYFEYGAYNGGTWTKAIKGSPSGTEWVKTYADMLGRSWKTEYPDGAYSTNGYNALGQLTVQRDPDGNATFYLYNAEGELETTVADVNKNGVMETNGPDRLVRTESYYTNVTGAGWSSVSARVSRTWQKNDANQEVLVSEHWASVDGLRTASFAGGLTNQTVTAYLGSGLVRRTQTAPNGTVSYSEYTNGRLVLSTNLNTGIGATYTYDAHGRVHQAEDARNGATTLGYNAADQVSTNTTPVPAAGLQAQVTTTHYNPSQQAWRIVQPDNTAVTNEFFLTGALMKTYGSRTYPVEYGNDYAGRMQTMKTWQDFAGNSGTATTAWNYDGQRGWLTGKTYQDTTSVTYSNTLAGRLFQRKWARNVTTTYSYSGAGDLTGVDYPGTADDVGYGYDRRGHQTTVTHGGSLLLTRYYNDNNHVAGEAYASGPLSGLSLTNLYDAQGHRTNVALKSGSTTLYSAGYAYSNGRLDSVSDGVNSAEYSYLAHSPLVEQIVFKQSSTTRMTTTKSYDLLNRLTGISSTPSASASVSFNYAYNSANQRVAVTNADNSRWSFGYDKLGQVTNAVKRWSDGSSVDGQQFGYGFDDIGNRKSAARDGRTASYTPNLLNQYTSRTVPGYLNVLGEATNAATVTVNLLPTSRKGDYFRTELTVTNSNPLWLGITNIAVLNQGTNADLIATNMGRLLVPQASEGFTYDADGNLTSDSLWTNVWNAENRRTNIESRASVPTAGKVREQWTYLPDGRWVERIVSTNNGSIYVSMQTNRYVWDGNVLLAVLNHTNGVDLAFMRGLDLSGTLQGAGGVGGLLAVKVGPAGPASLTNTTHFAAFDGNGNVAALVNAADGTESARYEYGPFNEPLRITGVMGKVNPIRFSTQYADDFTGDLKYLYRDLRDGRWLSRDPIGEEGGINPFGFVDGNPIARYDWLGLYTCADLEAIMSKARQRYREAVLSEVDGNDFLREIGWADFGVHASLTTSKAASATAFVMAGSPLVGFTGIGRSACVVGRVPATLNVSTTAGPVAIGEGYAATVGTGISQMAVTVPLMVARVPAAKYSSKTLQEKAEAALEQIATAQAVQQQTWALYKTAKLLHELGCTMRCICR